MTVEATTTLRVYAASLSESDQWAMAGLLAGCQHGRLPSPDVPGIKQLAASRGERPWAGRQRGPW